MNIEESAFKDRKTLANLNAIDLLDIIEFLQLDRKQWINQFSKTHNESIDIQKENQELKQKYENAVADYETTMAEKNELKRQNNNFKTSLDESQEVILDYIKENQELKEQVEDQEDFINKLQATKDKLDKWDYENTMKQKEFIKHLEDKINFYKINTQGYSMGLVKEILQKYREIIGDDKQ